uniref:polynucleotide adenylyltransferase n=1 Tax=Meloidogyne incognita TaxID=6306 RepID=A0A914NCZ3_MELIC
MTHHFIYSSQFGFLNGATLNLLILKIVLLYFDSSQIYLLQKFLETFIEWDWKFPVKLEELTQKSQSWKEETEINFRKNQYLSKYNNYSNEERIRLEKHTNPIMVVLTLGYPEQNCSYNVNNSTRKIILKEFENGIDLLNNAKNTNDGNENLKQAWKTWLNGSKFLEKYKHFLFILCIDKFHSKEGENYCRFIESRIRLELIFTIEEDQKQIDYTHATSKENCLPKIFLEKYR